MNNFEFLTQQSATIFVGACTITLTILLAFLRWLGNRFETLSKSITETTNLTQTWLREHEEKDQDRHIENLYRFEKIAVSLAKLGYPKEKDV